MATGHDFGAAESVALEPDRVSVKVGQLEVTGTAPRNIRVRVDGVERAVKRIVITIDASAPPTVVMEWYPGMEVVRTPHGVMLQPIADAPLAVPAAAGEGDRG